jgi:hypothetical protein
VRRERKSRHGADERGGRRHGARRGGLEGYVSRAGRALRMGSPAGSAQGGGSRPPLLASPAQNKSVAGGRRHCACVSGPFSRGRHSVLPWVWSSPLPHRVVAAAGRGGRVWGLGARSVATKNPAPGYASPRQGPCRLHVPRGPQDPRPETIPYAPRRRRAGRPLLLRRAGGGSHAERVDGLLRDRGVREAGAAA